MKRTSLKGVGLDTTSLKYELSDDLYFDYIHTSINANNENLISDWTETCQNVPLITSVDFLDHRFTLINHLKELKRTTIDLLLVDASCDFKEYKELMEEEIESGLVGEIGIRNPETTEQLEEIKKYLDFRTVALNICPLNFNHSIIKWCDEHDIMVVGFEPFGGKYNSEELIDTFGVQYLLGFSSKYVNLLLLPSSDAFKSNEYADILIAEYMMKPDASTKEIYLEKDEFLITKNVFKLKKRDPKPIVYTSIKIDSNTTIPCDLRYSIFGREEITNSFSEQKEVVERKTDQLSEELETLISSLHKPADLKDDSDWVSIVRLAILNYLDSLGKTVKYFQIGKKAFIFSVATTTFKRGFLGIGIYPKLIERNTYLLYTTESGEIKVQIINNGSEIS